MEVGCCPGVAAIMSLQFTNLLIRRSIDPIDDGVQTLILKFLFSHRKRT
jgi:hypothetical protein